MSEKDKTIEIPCANKDCRYSVLDRCTAPDIVFKAYGLCEHIIEPKKEARGTFGMEAIEKVTMPMMEAIHSNINFKGKTKE
jgi:hypothetical protein